MWIVTDRTNVDQLSTGCAIVTDRMNVDQLLTGCAIVTDKININIDQLLTGCAIVTDRINVDCRYFFCEKKNHKNITRLYISGFAKDQ